MEAVEFCLAFVACACLALSMNRHHLDATGARPSMRIRTLLKVAGWALLLLSYIAAGASRGWAIGTVGWFCVCGLSAIAIVILLNFRPRTVPGISAAVLLAAVILVNLSR